MPSHSTLLLLASLFTFSACGSPRATASPTPSVASVAGSEDRTNPSSAPQSIVDAGAPPAPPASSPPAPSSKAAPARAPGTPLVRPTKWVCEEQYCEGQPLLAYDYLPAVDETGTLVAFVEERDGWGHTARVGVHLVSGSTETAYLPTVTGDLTFTYADYAKKAAAHAAVVDAANAELSRRALRPLFPLVARKEESLVDGKWVTDGSTGHKRRVTYAYDNVSVVVTDPHDNDSAGSRFDSLVVFQDGKEVARRKGSDLPDQAGCGARVLRLEGVRPDVRTLALSFTNGSTSHACDGKKEPQVHHVVHW